MEGSSGGAAVLCLHRAITSLPSSINAAAATTISSSSCLLGTRMISHPFTSSNLPLLGKCLPSTSSNNAPSSGNVRRHRLSRPLCSKAIHSSSPRTLIGDQTATHFLSTSEGEIHSCNDRFSSKTSCSALPISRTEITARESEELSGAASSRTLLMPSKRMDALRFLNSGPKGRMAWLGQSIFRRHEDEKAEYEKARQFVEKVAEAERKHIEEDQEWERKAAIQFEREFMQTRAWQTFLLKLQGKLRGTAWDPEPGPSIPFSKFWKLLEAQKVNFLDYADFGEHVAVILPYYKDKEQTSKEGSENVQTDKHVPGDAAKASERDIVFKRHIVQRMPADNWTDVWRRLHRQLLNVEISNSNSLPRQIYPTFETTVVWGMRLLLAVVVFVWLNEKLYPFYRIRNPDDRPQRKRPKLDTINMELGSLGQSRARFISAEESTGVTFDDFAGQEYVKRELQEVVKILKQSKEFEDLGVYCPKGVLLYGPPGTGKTLLAKAIAGEAGVPFFSASGSEFVEMFVGVAAARVRDLFTRARQFAPSIVFIDEIDAIGAKRGGPDVGGGGVEREQGLIQILTELDGFQSIDSQVVVVGATNRLDMLDPALLRKGRFDKTISIGLPTEEGRLAILKVHARNKAFNSEQEKEKLLKELAGLTYEFSGAELQNILNEAAILAARKDKDTIEREELFEALRRQQGTFTTGEEDVLDVTGEAKVRLAYREASIAVLECYFPNPHRPFTKTNIRDMDTYPNMEYDEPRHRVFARKKDIVDSIVRACAPRIVEEQIFGKDNLSWISGSYLSQAAVIADYLILKSGMTALGKVYYNTQRDVMLHLGPKVQALRDTYMRYAVEKCSSVLEEYRSALETIADRLLEKMEIDAAEVWEIFRKAPRIPQPEVLPVDEYEALIYVGRWGIHGASLPGRVTFKPGNLGFATFGAPRPTQVKIISDDTWRMMDQLTEARLEELRQQLAMKEEEVTDVILSPQFL